LRKWSTVHSESPRVGISSDSTDTMRSALDIFTVYRAGSGSLAIVLRPRGGDWLAEEIQRIAAARVQVLVSFLTRDEQIELDLLHEAECCGAAEIEFVNVPIPDLGVPRDSAICLDAIARVVREISAGKSVAVHCRQSVGRSGLFTCGVLIAMGLPLDEAIAVVSSARGIAVPETAEQLAWLKANARALGRLNSA
jgi:protein-tyrosine phosphatase